MFFFSHFIRFFLSLACWTLLGSLCISFDLILKELQSFVNDSFKSFILLWTSCCFHYSIVLFYILLLCVFQHLELLIFSLLDTFIPAWPHLLHLTSFAYFNFLLSPDASSPPPPPHCHILRLDNTLEEIIFKLVPGLRESEFARWFHQSVASVCSRC